MFIISDLLKAKKTLQKCISSRDCAPWASRIFLSIMYARSDGYHPPRQPMCMKVQHIFVCRGCKKWYFWPPHSGSDLYLASLVDPARRVHVTVSDLCRFISSHHLAHFFIFKRKSAPKALAPPSVLQNALTVNWFFLTYNPLLSNFYLSMLVR